MHFFSGILLLGTASSVAATATSVGQLSTRNALSLDGIFKRQAVCVPVDPPYTCERSCGLGYIECISFPNCYNPGLGESCCSDGDYCPAGQYCTDTGCCPDGTSLADCGASVSLSVIPPPASSSPPSTSTSAIPASTSTSIFVGTTSSTSTATKPVASATSPSTSTSSVATTNSQEQTISVPTPVTTTTNSTSTTSTTPVQFTPNSSGHNLDSPIVNLVLGGSEVQPSDRNPTPGAFTSRLVGEDMNEEPDVVNEEVEEREEGEEEEEEEEGEARPLLRIKT